MMKQVMRGAGQIIDRMGAADPLRWLIEMLDGDGATRPAPRVRLRFAATYPGSPVEFCYLGAIKVGGIARDGQRAAWICDLPSGICAAGPFWRQADSIEQARDRLRLEVRLWLRAAEVAA